MSVVALIFVPLVVLYQGWTYHVFRARLGGDPEGDAAPLVPADGPSPG